MNAPIARRDSPTKPASPATSGPTPVRDPTSATSVRWTLQRRVYWSSTGGSTPERSRSAAMSAAWPSHRGPHLSTTKRYYNKKNSHIYHQCLNLPRCKQVHTSRKRRKYPQRLLHFLCKPCSRYYPTVDKLHSHICLPTGQTGDGPYACDQCPKKFSSAEYLEDHIRFQHSADSDTQQSCVVCKSVFSSLQELAEHVHIHGTRRSQTHSLFS